MNRFYYLWCLLVMLGGIARVTADCVIRTESPYPLLVSRFKTNTLISELKAPMSLLPDEEVTLFCPNRLRTEYQYLSSNQMNLSCAVDGIIGDGTYYTGQRLFCTESFEAQLYESINSLPSCERHMTMVIGFNITHVGEIKHLAVCYDMDELEVKYVSYIAYPSKRMIIKQNEQGELNMLDLFLHIHDVTQFFKSPIMIDETFVADKQLSNVFAPGTYELASLIQDQPLQIHLASYENMFKVIWWNALRKGNWRNFLNALEIATNVDYKIKYDVRVGVSGLVVIPMQYNCNQTRSLILDNIDGQSMKVPAHIWAHVRAFPHNIDNSTMPTITEFVLIGHNSPFVKNEDTKSICNSMCSEISWLRNTLFLQLHQYANYGLVQCCPLNDVANKLDNFPMPETTIN